MSDIFISYASEDRPRAQMLAQGLEGRGWSIFWDRTIPIGKTWRETIGSELEDARCVIVLWSKISIESGWVQEEADDAKRRGVLVPVMIDAVQPPIGFRSIQTADLANWDATKSTQPFNRLIADITALMGAPAKGTSGRTKATVEPAQAPPVQESYEHRPAWRRYFMPAAAGMMIVLALIMSNGLTRPSNEDARPNGRENAAARAEEDARTAKAEEGARSAKAEQDARNAKAEQDARLAKAEAHARSAKAEEDARSAKAEEDARNAKAAERARPAKAEEDPRDAKAAENARRVAAYSKFTVRANRDIYGQDIIRNGIRGLDIYGCAVQCDGDHRCAAFSFDRWNKICFLKSGITTSVLEPRSKIGVKNPYEVPNVSTVPSEIVMAYNRRFLASAVETRRVPTLEGCKTACVAEIKCVAFTFLRASGQADNCQMYKDVEEAYINDNAADSGWKEQPTR